VGRHLLKKHDYDAGFHVGLSSADQEIVTIRFFEQPGIQLTPTMQKEIEKHYSRQELRRAAAADVGTVDYPVQARESYAADLLATLDADAIRSRGYRIVVDYGYSAASLVLPLVLGPLGVEAVSAHAFSPAQAGSDDASLRSLIGQTKKLVAAVGADFGAVFDRAAERLYLIDEKGHEIPVEQTLLLFLRLLGSNGRRGKLAFPVTVTSEVDRIVKKSDLEIIRTPASLSELTRAAAADDVIFAGAVGGGYVFPDFLPAYDATASLCNLLELLAPVEQPLSSLVADLPVSTLVHRQLHCPWSQKGLVMRVLTERLKDRKLDLLDGIKVTDRRGWAQVLPDADEPLIHIYAEGSSDEVSNELEEELRSLVEDVLQREVGETEAQISS
jgi:mannose-1-phosphate guanylyltransferase / phosphomannomutase